ncbi:hypothetical protein ACFY9S_08165 [Streptomyces sp. NPDC012474]|uniref:hypothetical protein n=1 Tax=Streptomyces sp. NPDC012474 TaxID=3364836 RepID=UPI0036F15B87
MTTSSIAGTRSTRRNSQWNKRLREIAALTVAAVALGVAAPLASATAAERDASAMPKASAAAEVETGLDALESLEEEAAFNGLEEALQIVSEIPEEILEQGQEATEQWLQARLGETAGEGRVQPMKFNAGGCARGILLAVGSNLLAVGKIYKVKKAIDKLGGIKKVVKKIQDKKKRGKKSFKKAIMEVFEESGTGMGAIAMEILGVDQVVKNCW